MQGCGIWKAVVNHEDLFEIRIIEGMSADHLWAALEHEYLLFLSKTIGWTWSSS
jgi:hypothetical protein